MVCGRSMYSISKAMNFVKSVDLVYVSFIIIFCTITLHPFADDICNNLVVFMIVYGGCFYPRVCGLLIKPFNITLIIFEY